jgi:stearoyl-CoA desaturase (delta-9 desaturase)
VLWGEDRADPKQYAPDLMNDRDMASISRHFRGLAAISLLAPALIGGLWDRSWHGAATAFFWATLVRIALMHHVTFSINSICHVTGKKPFEARDRSGNVWWLAILSQGESWHNLHHADPTCARHGVLRGQVDINAWLIKWFERFGWAYDVRWPNQERLAKKLSG